MIQQPRAPRVRIAATGRYSPPRIVTNAELETLVDTSDEWIRTRTGIRERRIADKDTHASDMAAAAARTAMERAGVEAGELDMILLSTATPDRLLPSTACDVQALLGARNAAAYDYATACSGFLYGLSMAEAHIVSGQAETVLVCATETRTSEDIRLTYAVSPCWPAYAVLNGQFPLPRYTTS